MHNFWEYPTEGTVYEDGNHLKIMVYKRKLTKEGMMCYLRDKYGVFPEPYKDSWIMDNLKYVSKHTSIEGALNAIQ